MMRCQSLWAKRILILLAAVAIAVTAGIADAEAARKKRKSAPQVDRYASVVIDADTGFVISEKNADKRLYPASLTKMMTLYMMFEALDSGLIRKNDRMAVSKRAAAQEPSKLDLKPGTTVRVEDAILGLVTKSANDAAVVIAEKLGGSEANFAKMMTRKAQALGMNSTRFANASGLHNAAQYSTARDMATLGQALIRDYPRHYRYFSTRNFSYAGRTYNNHNHLMKTYNGMDGIKTGYVYASGFNLVASAKRGDNRLIGVVFGGRTAKTRNDHMQVLLDNGFSRLRDPRVAILIDKRRAALATRSGADKTASAAIKTQGFNAAQLVEESIGQGDADEEAVFENRRVSLESNPSLVRDFKPRPLNTRTTLENQPKPSAAKVATRNTKAGGWAVQIGAFSSHDAGMAALHAAHRKLPATISGQTEYVIVPLMTNRGMIYRARMTQLDRDHAAMACRVLQDNCLILATQ